MSNSDEPYKVGYKRPPLHTRFQPGQGGGNRKGRVKDNRNLKTDLQDELAERVTLNEGGKKIRISKQRALIKSLVVKGIKGDDRAIGKAFDLLLRVSGVEDFADPAAPINEEDDAAVIAAFVRANGGGHDRS